VSIQPAEILGILHALRSVAVPTWLSGGAAVEFLVVRWTRPHKDLDLVAFTPYRGQLEPELGGRGSRPAHDEDGPRGGRSLVVTAPVWRLCSSSPPLPRPGCWSFRRPTGAWWRTTLPMVAGYLDPHRYRELDGVRSRTCSSAEGEWLNRLVSDELVPGRTPDPKLQHDIELLQPLIPEPRHRGLLDTHRRRWGTDQAPS
jgi:hypothetical protein